MDTSSQAEGAMPGNDESEGQAVTPGESPGEGETPPQGNDDPPENEGDTPLHKALKAERQTVKELKTSVADLSAKVAEYESAELQRKTSELAAKANLNPEQAKALETLKTFEERKALAAVMNPPHRLHRSIAGKTPPPTFQDRLMAKGLNPEAIKQIYNEVNANYRSRQSFNGMDEDQQFSFIVQRAKLRGLVLSGKKTTPIY